MARLTAVTLLVVFLARCGGIWARKNRDCRNKATEDCPGDIRYRDEGNNLAQQAEVWRRSGFYKVQVYHFNGEYQTDQEIQVTPQWQRHPTIGFVNITIKETRYYYHAYFILVNLIRAGEGKAAYRDIFGHSSYEKDGRVLLLDERSQDPFDLTYGVRTPATSAYIMPVGRGATIRRVAGGVLNPFIRSPLGTPGYSAKTAFFEVETTTCVEATDCRTMSFIKESFTPEGERVGFTTGTYKEMEESSWKDDILRAYDEKEVLKDYRKDFPMTATCLVGEDFCPTEDEWCVHGDPSCSESPYQDDVKLRPGVIVGIVISSVGFGVLGCWVAWYTYTTKKERRYRTFYVTRFAEDVSLQKAMRDITPENMEREFNFIDKDGKGYVTKGELMDFMLTTKIQPPIGDADFTALWTKMDMDGNGSVDYAEFCAFTADCYFEHSSLRNKIINDAKKSSGSAAPSQ